MYTVLTETLSSDLQWTANATMFNKEEFYHGSAVQKMAGVEMTAVGNNTCSGRLIQSMQQLFIIAIIRDSRGLTWGQEKALSREFTHFPCLHCWVEPRWAVHSRMIMSRLLAVAKQHIIMSSFLWLLYWCNDIFLYLSNVPHKDSSFTGSELTLTNDPIFVGVTFDNYGFST